MRVIVLGAGDRELECGFEINDSALFRSYYARGVDNGRATYGWRLNDDIL